MYCKVCGKELPRGAERCDECGTPVDGVPAGTDRCGETQAGSQDTGRAGSFDTGDGYYQDNRNRYDNGDPYYYDNGRQPVYERQSGARKGFAIASLVLGIIGLLGTCCSLFTYGILSILLGVIGLIFGILGLKSNGKGMAIAGIVMAGINLIIGILLMILMVASTKMAEGMTPEEYDRLFEELESLYGLEMLRLKGFLLK